MVIDTNIHLDGPPILSLHRGERFTWIVLRDVTGKNDLRIFMHNHDAETEATLRRAVEAFNAAINEQPLSEAAE